MPYSVYIGIDVGKNGAIVSINNRNKVHRKVMPTDKKTKEISLPILSEIFNDYIDRYGAENILVGIEDVHSIFGASAKANFQFGRGLGMLEGYVGSCKIPFIKIAPKEWQKIAHAGIPTLKKAGKKTNDTKAMSLLACQRLYPTLDILASGRCTVPHDGIVDAVLIAHYMRNTYK